jgi:ribose transport system substrate-binding protein
MRKQDTGHSMGLWAGGRALGGSLTLRATVALTVVASVLAFTACGSSDTKSSGNGSAKTTTGAADGIKTPSPLKPFEAGAAGEKPDLPKRLAWAMDNDREFSQAVKTGLEAAAKDNGLDFVSAIAGGDSAKNVQQIQQFLAQGIGALAVIPIDPAAQAPLMKDALKKGIAVQGLAMPPATTQANANQYETGRVVAADAAKYIRTKLGGKANVVILNQDTVQVVRPRFKAMRDEIRKVPGAKIVADVEPESIDKDGAFKTMSTILQKNPKVDVVLGADAHVLGALAALEAAHKDSPQQYLGGIDGEPEALANIRKGGPYKATVALAPAMFAYAMGQNAADWLAGKPIPQAIDINPILLNSPRAIDLYEADENNPSAAYKDPGKRGTYLKLFGSISYETRGNFLDYSWAP